MAIGSWCHSYLLTPLPKVQLLAAIVEHRLQEYAQTQETLKKIDAFESSILRPYFHIKVHITLLLNSYLFHNILHFFSTYPIFLFAIYRICTPLSIIKLPFTPPIPGLRSRWACKLESLPYICRILQWYYLHNQTLRALSYSLRWRVEVMLEGEKDGIPFDKLWIEDGGRGGVSCNSLNNIHYMHDSISYLWW